MRRAGDRTTATSSGEPTRNRQSEARRTDVEYVTASEAAGYAYCAKAWHLEHVLHHQPSAAGRAARASGTAQHQLDGRRVQAVPRRAKLLLFGSIASLAVAALLVLAAIYLIGK